MTKTEATLAALINSTPFRWLRTADGQLTVPGWLPRHGNGSIILGRSLKASIAEAERINAA